MSFEVQGSKVQGQFSFHGSRKLLVTEGDSVQKQTNKDINKRASNISWLVFAEKESTNSSVLHSVLIIEKGLVLHDCVNSWHIVIMWFVTRAKLVWEDSYFTAWIYWRAKVTLPRDYLKQTSPINVLLSNKLPIKDKCMFLWLNIDVLCYGVGVGCRSKCIDTVPTYIDVSCNLSVRARENVSQTKHEFWNCESYLKV